VSVQALPPRKKKEKTPVAHTALPSQPTHPHPIKNAPSSKGTQLTILQRSPPKEETKKDRKCKEMDETSSQSSQEAELDASLAGKNVTTVLASSKARQGKRLEKHEKIRRSGLD
jgi:hypothetical protein